MRESWGPASGGAVQSAIDNGDTLEDFRASFDKAVEKYGWAHTGGRDWRSRVIFETNLRTAYSAGRYEQLQETKKLRPYWEYRHGGSKKPRAEHKAWSGMILRADDPWWETHYPPNGWGCSCKVFAVGKRELRNRGIDPEELTEGKCVTRDARGKSHVSDIPYAKETVEWVSKDGTRRETLPRGVQPGWAYNVGKAGGAEKQREDNVRQEMESQTPIPPPQKNATDAEKKAREDKIREHLRSHTAATKGAGAIVVQPTGEKYRATGIIENVARKISLEKLGFREEAPPPNLRNIPEAAVNILNERLENELRRPERIRTISHLEPGGYRLGSVVLRPLASDDKENDVVNLLKQSTYEEALSKNAHSFEKLTEHDAEKRRLTTVIAEAKRRDAFEAAKNGDAVFWVGLDGNVYFEAVIDDKGGKALFLIEKSKQQRDTVHWYPVSGQGVFNLSKREAQALAKMREEAKRKNRRLNSDELDAIVEATDAPQTEQRNMSKLLSKMQDVFL